MICILMHIIFDAPPARAISPFHRKNAIFRITSQRRDAINITSQRKDAINITSQRKDAINITSQRRDAINITSQRRDAINRVSTGVGGVSSANIRIKSLYEYLYY